MTPLYNLNFSPLITFQTPQFRYTFFNFTALIFKIYKINRTNSNTQSPSISMSTNPPIDNPTIGSQRTPLQSQQQAPTPSAQPQLFLPSPYNKTGIPYKSQLDPNENNKMSLFSTLPGQDLCPLRAILVEQLLQENRMLHEKISKLERNQSIFDPTSTY